MNATKKNDIKPQNPSQTMEDSADIFTLHHRNYHCIVDYHSKFPVIKKMEDLSADSLIQTCKFLSEFGYTKKIMSDSGSNFILDECKTFYRRLNIEQAVSSSCHHKSNGKVKVCIKLIK